MDSNSLYTSANTQYYTITISQIDHLRAAWVDTESRKQSGICYLRAEISDKYIVVPC
jgi:hypothetical protein